MHGRKCGFLWTIPDWRQKTTGPLYSRKGSFESSQVVNVGDFLHISSVVSIALAKILKLQTGNGQYSIPATFVSKVLRLQHLKLILQPRSFHISPQLGVDVALVAADSYGNWSSCSLVSLKQLSHDVMTMFSCQIYSRTETFVF